MRVDIQWTTDPAQDWITIDSRDWFKLPKKDEPVGGEIIDSTLGWIWSVNVQGVAFSADHYAVVHQQGQGFVAVYAWNDDPDDYPLGEKYGMLWVFRPVAPDPNLGGRDNTAQTMDFYGEVDILSRKTSGNKHTFAEFDPPIQSNRIRHGIQIPDELADTHRAFPSAKWSDWIGDDL